MAAVEAQTKLTTGKFKAGAEAKSWDRLILAALLVVAAVLRFAFLDKKSFWFDESVSVAIARLPAVDLIRLLWRREANMTLYYLLLRGWLLFGHSEFFVRTLSVLPALATLPALYALGRRLFDARVGLIATTLLACHALHVRYSQEARSYTLMLFLCTLSSSYFLKYLDSPSSENRAVHISISALAVYAHFYAGLLMLTQWLSLRWLDRQRIPRQVTKNWRGFLIAVSPLILFVVATGAGPLRWIPRPGLAGFWRLALFMTGNGGSLLFLAYAAACLGALAPAVHVQPAPRVSWEWWRFRFLLLWLLFPAVLTGVLSYVRPLFLPRYYIFCLPALLLLAARGLSRLRSPWLLGSALLLFLTLSCRGTFSYYQQDFDIQRDDWRGATEYLLDNSAAGDALMFHVAMGRMSYEYYRSLHRDRRSGADVIYPRHADHITFLDFVQGPDRNRLAAALPQHPRTWLVLTYQDPPGSDPNTRLLDALLRRDHPSVQQRNFRGIEVRLYSK